MSQKDRSKTMSLIRSKNTKPEKLLRSSLWKRGLRYLVHPKIKGKPDIIFKKNKIAIFIDGCFWHMCPICFKPPKSNIDYWKPKLNRNKERDKTVTLELEEEGWTVLRFWEHEIFNDLDSVEGKILSTIKSVK